MPASRVVVALALLVSTRAAADMSVVNVSPAFPPGPYTAITVDSKNPRRVAVGTASGQIAWSEDAGRTASESTAISSRTFSVTSVRSEGWSSRYLLPNRSVRAVHLFNAAMQKGLPFARWAMWMAFNDPITEISGVALPAADGRMVLSSGGGVYLSDAGRSMWTRTLGGPAPMPDKKDLVATVVAISPTNPRLVLAGTNKGLYISHDGGFTFSAHQQTEMMDAILGLVWDPIRPEVILAITGDAIFQSSDQGKRFVAAFSGGDVRDVTLTDDGALVATSSGVHVITGTGEKKMANGQSVIGAVPWQDGATLVASQTALFALRADGRRVELMHTTEQDPFVRLVGRPPFAYAMTSSGVFRIGQVEKRVVATRPPRLRLSLVELERIVMRNTIRDPEDTRLHDRWYARLLPRLVVDVSGYVDRSESIKYDGTLQTTFRRAEAGATGRTEWMVFATWDLSKILFGDNNVSDPGLLRESQVRSTRERLQRELRSRYREAAVLAHQLARPPADPVTAFHWRMRLEELSAYLEALAGREVVDVGSNEPFEQGE